MLISTTWLRELWVDGGGAAAADDARIVASLTRIGLEVESSRRFGDEIAGVVVGEVRAVQPHPKADKLHVVELFDGTAVHTVVCGAGNLPAPGGRVAFVPPGTRLPGGLEIGAREIRGVASHGMIASEAELDIGSDSAGILVLPDDFVPGQRLCDRVPAIVDTVIELSVTPNRPDALGHVGVARDLAVQLGLELRLPARGAPVTPPPAPGLVTVEAPTRCGRYLGVALGAAVVAPSPPWLRVRLHRVGLRAINNVVDVTNFVLMEWGQPLHAFDRDRLTEGRVVIRAARAGEPLVTLDGRTLELERDDLVIADARAPVALAGVMGGEGSGVGPSTRNLLLEVAHFEPAGIRRTARAHGIASDSSYRFERGVDPDAGLDGASARAVALLTEVCAARVEGALEVRAPVEAKAPIGLRSVRIRRVLGIDIAPEVVERVLGGLGVVVARTGTGEWSCVAPGHRPDLMREEDLIEEVLRHHGYDHLPAVAVPVALGIDRAGDRERPRLQARIAELAVAAGYCECVTMAMSSDEGLDACVGSEQAPARVRVRNPMRSQHAVLRSHLLPGLLDVLALNAARHGRPVRLFELGRTYLWAPHATAAAGLDGGLPRERVVLGLLAADRDPEGGSDLARSVGRALVELLDASGVQVAIGEGEQLPSLPWLHPGVRAALGPLGGGPSFGSFGRLHPDLARHWQLPETLSIAYGEIDLDALVVPARPVHAALPRFPATSRDVSLELDVAVATATVVSALVAGEDRICASSDPERDAPRLQAGDTSRHAVQVVEDYRGTGVGPGRRALLLRLHYRCRERSVTDDEVQAHHEALVRAALETLRVTDPAARRR